MSLFSVFIVSRQTVVLCASACVAVASVAVSLNQENQAPRVVSDVTAGMTAPAFPATPAIRTAASSNVTTLASLKPAVAPPATATRQSATTQSKTALAEKDPVAQMQTPQAPVVSATDAQNIRLGAPANSLPQRLNVVVASADLGAVPDVATKPLGKPALGVAALTTPKANLKFDLVRVDKAGSAVVAGKATPGQTVIVNIDGVKTAQAETNARGGFVALFDVPASANPQVITLSAKDKSGELRVAPEQVIVMGRKVTKPAAADTSTEIASADVAPVVENDVAPAIILTSDEGIKVVQPAAPQSDIPEVMANVSLDLISYDSSGEVVLTGRSKPDRHVRVYLDGKPIKTNPVAKDGSWQLSLPEVKAGRYTLRIDEINGKGQVTSRLETPFQKEVAADAKRVASTAALTEPDGASGIPRIQKVTIQPGATLWALAKTNYGKGDLYMQIFNANRDTIRDPNLIYPGQIFKIPE